LTVIRGIVKKKFPSVKTRTVSLDLAEEVKRLKSGVRLQLITTDKEPDYGYIQTVIGTVSSISYSHKSFSGPFVQKAMVA